METEEKEPIFTKKRIIIGAAVLLVLLILGYFLFFRGNNNIKVERVELAQTNVSLKPGETFILRGYVFPSNATNKKLQYTTTDSSIITVNNSGLITAIKEGNAQVVVKSPDTNIVAACDVTVSNSLDVATNLVFEALEMTINKGAKKLLTITVLPDTAPVPALAFASSDSNVVTVDNEGYITGVNTGSATITVTGNNSVGTALTTSIKINVVNAPVNNGGDTPTNPVIKVENISLSKTEFTVEVGKEYQLVPTINATGGTPTVTWTSDNTAVATVDNTGKVKGITEGTAKITATAGDKTTVATATVVKAGSTSGGSSGGSTKDTTGPSISITNTTTVGENGWFKEVILQVTANDRSGIASINYCLTSGGQCAPTGTLSSGGTVRVTRPGMVLVVFATDKKGNQSSKISSSYAIDNTAPTCIFGAKNGDVSYNSAPDSVPIIIHGTDTGSGVLNIKTPSAFVQTGSEASYVIASNGTHTATVTDKAGNTGTCSINVSGIKQDITAPICNISPNTYSTAASLTLTVKTAAVDLNSTPYSWQSATSGFSGTSTKTIYNNGVYTAYVRDGAGNVGHCSITVSNIITDTTAPTISITPSGTLGNNGWYKSNVTVKASVNEPGSRFQYCTNIGQSCTPGPDYPSAGITLGSGNWVVGFKATDANGNSTTRSATYNIDTTKPTSCTPVTTNAWETSKKLTIAATDTYSGMSRINLLWNNTYQSGGLAVRTVSSYGQYLVTCEDKAGNKSSGGITLISKQEYRYRTCYTHTFTPWVRNGGTTAEKVLYPSITEAESRGLTYYYNCVYDEEATDGKYQSCAKFTRTVNGCTATGWAEWNPWGSAVVTDQPGYVDAESQTLYNKQ